ncbi:Uncharacterised protein [Halioglobus japonicus]|nr:Uncharacterised protein [Halioglobus japonicus]
MKARAFVLRALICALAGSFVVAGVNYFVDPYGITGVARIPGLNEYKSEINEHTRVLKKYQPLFSPHNALIVGNSRVELGIPPEHACFREAGMDVYNLGMPGAGVATQLAYALNLIYQQPVTTVFLSVDFTDFISTSDAPGTGTWADLEAASEGFRFSVDEQENPGYYWAVLRDYFKSLFSLDALVASAKTILLQRTSSADRDLAGFNPARDFDAAVKIEGPRALFDQKMANLSRKYSRPWYFHDSKQQPNAAMKELARFLDIAAARGIKVYLFTNPFHQDYWALFSSQGHMQAYNDWMTSLETLASAYPDGSVELWDFSGDSPFIHETVPAAGVLSGPLQWFWEPAHYRSELGELMVDTMLAESCDTEIAFGRKVF